MNFFGKITVGDYQYTESATNFLGEGTFGIVFKGHHKNDKYQTVALKKITRTKFEEYKLQREVDVMENIAHQNCVKFLGHVVTEDGLYHYIITELCECNLYKYLKDVGGTFDQFHMILTAKKLAIGYKYLYERKIIHRDIKLENILVGAGFQLKFADFGCARFMVQTYHNTLAGTVPYRAPEASHWATARYDARGDIWSIGIVLFKCATGEFPWDEEINVNNDLDIIKYRNKILTKLEHIELDPDLPPLLLGMLEIPYEDRMKPEEFFEHEFVNRKVFILNTEDDDSRKVDDNAQTEKQRMRKITYVLGSTAAVIGTVFLPAPVFALALVNYGYSFVTFLSVD